MVLARAIPDASTKVAGLLQQLRTSIGRFDWRGEPVFGGVFLLDRLGAGVAYSLRTLLSSGQRSFSHRLICLEAYTRFLESATTVALPNNAGSRFVMPQQKTVSVCLPDESNVRQRNTPTPARQSNPEERPAENRSPANPTPQLLCAQLLQESCYFVESARDGAAPVPLPRWGGWQEFSNRHKQRFFALHRAAANQDRAAPALVKTSASCDQGRSVGGGTVKLQVARNAPRVPDRAGSQPAVRISLRLGQEEIDIDEDRE